MKHKPRFYCPELIPEEGEFFLSLMASHHLWVVLRQKIGGRILLFNEKVGEWEGEIVGYDKKIVAVKILSQTKNPPASHRKIFLCFALLEKSRLDILIAKATELAVTDFVPIITDFTEIKNWQAEKWHRVAVSATEQSGRLTTPHCHEAMKLKQFESFITQQQAVIFYGDEKARGDSDFAKKLSEQMDSQKNIALLVGPPAGFSDDERRWLASLPHCHGVSLGQNILRSETAGMAMLAGLLFYHPL